MQEMRSGKQNSEHERPVDLKAEESGSVHSMRPEKSGISYLSFSSPTGKVTAPCDTKG